MSRYLETGKFSLLAPPAQKGQKEKREKLGKGRAREVGHVRPGPSGLTWARWRRDVAVGRASTVAADWRGRAPRRSCACLQEAVTWVSTSQKERLITAAEPGNWKLARSRRCFPFAFALPDAAPERPASHPVSRTFQNYLSDGIRGRHVSGRLGDKYLFYADGIFYAEHGTNIDCLNNVLPYRKRGDILMEF